MSLSEENGYVLDLVQALLGAISPNFRGVTLACTRNGVRLLFLLEQESAEDREEIEDIASEFLALQPLDIDFEVVVLVSTQGWDELKVPGRRVYSRKESSVSLFIMNDRERKDRLVPIATEDVFNNYWQKACLFLNLKFVPLFQSGLPIALQDVDEILSELNHLKTYFYSCIGVSSNDDVLLHIISRIDNLVFEISHAIENPDNTFWIG